MWKEAPRLWGASRVHPRPPSAQGGRARFAGVGGAAVWDVPCGANVPPSAFLFCFQFCSRAAAGPGWAGPGASISVGSGAGAPRAHPPDGGRPGPALAFPACSSPWVDSSLSL